MRNGNITKCEYLIEIRANVIYYSKMMGFKVSPAEMDTYLFLVSFNQDWGSHPVTYDDWDRYTSLHRRTVQRVLSSLEKMKLIERTFGTYPNSKGRSCPHTAFIKANDTSLYIKADIIKQGNAEKEEDRRTAGELRYQYMGAMA